MFLKRVDGKITFSLKNSVVYHNFFGQRDCCKMKIILLLTLLSSVVIAKKPNLETSSLGAPVGDDSSSLTAGPRGPVLLQDTMLLEKLAHFSREKIPERVTYGKGVGAYGYFVVTDDITRYSKAAVFNKIGKTTPVFARLSAGLVAEKDSPDTRRDTRGFATKFYTEEGNWDLIAINMPISFTRDPLSGPDFVHCARRHPVSNLQDPNAVWDFVSLKPESTFAVTYFYSDRGNPDGYRYMDLFAVNTYKFVNGQDQACYCKFHLISDQGIRNLSPEKAKQLQLEDPDYSTRDLFSAIENGEYPSWTLYIQIMTFQQAEAWHFNPFDSTKLWPKKEFPLIRVGKLELNRNVRNYFAEVEQSAFSPANLIPGIEPSPDKILQGRLFVYSDAQRYRVGANFKQIPINKPRNQPRNYERDGPQTVTDNQGCAVNYYPNSFGGPEPDPSYKESCFKTSGDVCRYNSSNEDNFTQAGIFYREVLNEEERGRLIDNMVKDLSQVYEFIQERAVKNFYKADPYYGSRVEEGLREVRQARRKLTA